MKFLINNIFSISIIIFFLIHLFYWILDKIKTKKAILDAQIAILDAQMEIKELESSIKSLRNTNHKILNLINQMQLKLYCDENDNKTN